MSTARALLAASLAVTPHAHAQAFRARLDAPLHSTETEARRSMRSLLDAAALTGAQVRVAFIKADLSLRYMLAAPCLGADHTAQFYTVLDLEASDLAGRGVYRRICLDSVAGLGIDWSPAVQ